MNSVPKKTRNLESRIAVRVMSDDLNLLRKNGADISEIVRAAIKSAADTLRVDPVVKV